MSTITSILSTDLVSDSRTTINTNFSNLNTDKTEVGYALQASGALFSPADSTTYFFGQSNGAAPFVVSQGQRIYIPKAGTIKSCYLFFNVITTPATSETSTVSLRLNDTTDTTITSSLTVSANNNVFSNIALSIAVVAGDYFEMKWLTPAWSTNPVNMRCSAVIYIE